MTSMVERVARALWEETLPEEKWEATPEPLLRQWRRAARAAIEAMREPNNDMRWAVAKLAASKDPAKPLSPQAGEVPAQLARLMLDGYAAMISASLLPPQSEE